MLTGVGTFRDPNTTVRFAAEPFIDPIVLNDVFQSNGVGRRVVELPAEEMIRPWFTVSGRKGGEILDYLETIGAQQLVTDAVVWARLYGGSAVVFAMEGQGYDTPVTSVSRLLGGRAFDRYQVTPLSDVQSQDPVRRLHGLPGMIEVSTNGSYVIGPSKPEENRIKVHEDRFVFVPGARVPNRTRSQLNGWDVSVLQFCHEAIVRYSMGLGYSSNILRDFVQSVLSVKGLTNMLAAGKQSVVEDRIQLLDLSRSILNSMIIDSDGEQYSKVTSSVSGIDGLIDRYLEALSMSSGIPVTKLAGRSAGGLNATGDNDLRNYYDMLAAERHRVTAPLVERLVKYAYMAADGPTGGVEPRQWSIIWNPFFQPTEVEQADLRKKIADTDKIYLDARVLSPAEVAKSRWGQGEWRMETELDATEDEGRATFESMAEEQLSLIEAAKTPAKEETPGSEDRGDAAPRSLYVSRKVVNAADLLKWAQAEGLEALEPADELHVTVTYSRTAVDWMKMGESWQATLEIPEGGPRLVEQFDGGALVLLFTSSELRWRNQSMRDAGASFDYDEYQPHITIAYGTQSVDVRKITPYTGKLVLGPEIFEEIK